MTASPTPRGDTETLRSWLGADHVELHGKPTDAGYSNDTLFFEADGTSLVLRCAPARQGMFAHHNLDVQVRCMQHIRAHGLPAPAIVAVDLEGETFGRPAYIMERVIGRVPGDNRPAFTRAGFLFDASYEQQQAFGEHLVDCLADLHRLPVLGGLPIGPTVRDHLQWCSTLRTDSDGDSGGPLAALLDRAEAALHASAPEDIGPPALLWGDARPANTIVDDTFHVAALLDWEMSGTGAPEFDVAWMNEMNRMRAADIKDPVLPGMPTEAEVWKRWSARTGRTACALEWHRLYAAYKVALLMDRHLAERVRNGGMASDHPLRKENRASRRLSELMNTEVHSCRA